MRSGLCLAEVPSRGVRRCRSPLSSTLCMVLQGQSAGAARGSQARHQPTEPVPSGQFPSPRADVCESKRTSHTPSRAVCPAHRRRQGLPGAARAVRADPGTAERHLRAGVLWPRRRRPHHRQRLVWASRHGEAGEPHRVRSPTDSLSDGATVCRARSLCASQHGAAETLNTVRSPHVVLVMVLLCHVPAPLSRLAW